jgi:thiamine kinase-like enzyme
MVKKENLIKEILGKTATIDKPLLGGMMNQSYILFNNDLKYVLYLPTEQANEMVDRALEKKGHDIAYSLGITSKNIYFDTKTGIKINEFIEGSSLNYVDEYSVEKVAKLLKTLHNSPILMEKPYKPFEKLINYEIEANDFISSRNEDYLLLRNILFSNREKLENRALCLCHNDAQKSNIVKSNNDEYFLIDFEFMYDNDPIYDIAAFGNGTVEEGYELLKVYFSEELNNNLKQIYYLWRIFLSLQWHNVALIKHFRKEGEKHNIDFMHISEFFLENAKTAYSYLKDL